MIRDIDFCEQGNLVGHRTYDFYNYSDHTVISARSCSHMYCTISSFVLECRKIPRIQYHRASIGWKLLWKILWPPSYLSVNIRLFEYEMYIFLFMLYHSEYIQLPSRNRLDFSAALFDFNHEAVVYLRIILQCSLITFVETGITSLSSPRHYCCWGSLNRSDTCWVAIIAIETYWQHRLKHPRNLADHMHTCRCDLIFQVSNKWVLLTHWGRVTHIYVGKLAIIGSDYGLSPCPRQAIVWNNDGILLTGPLGTDLLNCDRNSSIFIYKNAFQSIVCEMVAILSRPQCVNWIHARKSFSPMSDSISLQTLLPLCYNVYCRHDEHAAFLELKVSFNKPLALL